MQPWLRDPRWLFAGLLLSFAVIGQLFLGFTTTWWQMGTAVVASMLLELAFSRVVTGRWNNPVSALMTGTSIGILLTTRNHIYWPYLLAALVAIGSKYALRYRGNHIFNPSNLAMAVLTLALPGYVISNPSQWTNALWPMLGVMALGLVVARRARRLRILATFVISFAVLAVVRSQLQQLPLLWAIGPVMGTEFQLFSFFMITDPRTSPRAPRAQIAYSIVIALLDALLRSLRVTYSLFYVLTLTCCLVPWMDRLHAAAEPVPARVTRSKARGA